MNVHLENIGKRFEREWIFKNVNLTFTTNSITGIVGPNGSGKSTLLQCISGFLTTSEGTIRYQNTANQIVSVEQVYRQVSIAAPYLDQEEWLTFREAVKIQSQFKPFRNQLSTEEVIEKSGLSHAADKFIRQFSSGMKQRVRLSLAILAQGELLLLDEPLSNLDHAGTQWFLKLLSEESKDRTVIICSNHHAEELAMAERKVDLSQFKPNS